MTATAAQPTRRTILLVLAGVAPLLAAAGLWWVVDAWVLAPRIPGATSGGEECVSFVAHEKGLVRLSAERQRRFLDEQRARMLRDVEFRRDVLSALRRAAPDTRAALEGNLLDALKPTLLDDVRRYHALTPAERPDFLDERLVEYQRFLGAFSGERAESAGLFDKQRLTNLILARTSDAERELGAVYVTSLLARQQEIRADADLRRRFELRVADAMGSGHAVDSAPLPGSTPPTVPADDPPDPFASGQGPREPAPSSQP